MALNYPQETIDAARAAYEQQAEQWAQQHGWAIITTGPTNQRTHDWDAIVLNEEHKAIGWCELEEASAAELADAEAACDDGHKTTSGKVACPWARCDGYQRHLWLKWIRLTDAERDQVNDAFRSAFSAKVGMDAQAYWDALPAGLQKQGNEPLVRLQPIKNIEHWRSETLGA